MHHIIVLSVGLHFKLFIYLFIFSNHFILVRYLVDPEPISVALGKRLEYTPDGMSVYLREVRIHKFTLNVLWKIKWIHLMACCWEVAEILRNMRKHLWTLEEHRNSTQTLTSLRQQSYRNKEVIWFVIYIICWILIVAPSTGETIQTHQ